MDSADSNILLYKAILPLLLLFVTIYGVLISIGIGFEAFDQLGNRTLWIGITLPLFLLGLIAVLVWIHNHFRQLNQAIRSVSKYILSTASFAEKVFLATTILVTFANLLLCFLMYPYNGDSAAAMLPRSLYFIQHGNTDFFDANYWAQITHPIYDSFLKIAFWMIFGFEKSVNLIQFFGGISGAVSIVGISLLIGNSLFGSILAGCVFLNLTIVNLQMTSTQLDLLMAALLGCSLFFGFLWIRKRSLYLAFFSGASFGIALGMKSSAILYVPSMLLLLAWYIWRSRSVRKLFEFSVILSLILITVFWFAGYQKNLRTFDDPIGPDLVYVEHSLKGENFSDRMSSGVRNMVRYSSQLLSLDGLPSVSLIHSAHAAIQRLFIYPFRKLGIDVNTSELTRTPFLIDRPLAHEDVSYWGILGIPIFFSVFWSLVKCDRRFLPLAISFVVFIGVQGFSGQYDPWRGRYFIAGAVFATPLSAQWWTISTFFSYRRLIFRRCISILLIVAAVSSVTTLAFRDGHPLVTNSYGEKQWQSVFRLNRTEQIVRGNLDLAASLNKLTQWIESYPEELNLYTALPENFPEYLLFRGNTVIPLNGFLSGFTPGKLDNIERGLLIYHKEIFNHRQSGDIDFGSGLSGRTFLRSD